MRPAAKKQRDAIWKKLLGESQDKKIPKYLFFQIVILCDLPINLVQNHIFCP